MEPAGLLATARVCLSPAKDRKPLVAFHIALGTRAREEELPEPEHFLGYKGIPLEYRCDFTRKPMCVEMVKAQFAAS